MSKTSKALIAVGIFIGATAILFRLFGPPLHSRGMITLYKLYFYTSCVFVGASQMFRPELKYKILGAACIAGYLYLMYFVLQFYSIQFVRN